MKMKLLDLSEKIDNRTVELCEALSIVAGRLDVPFFLVGATALDFVFHAGHNIKPKRLTYDLDIAVEVPSWESYETLKKELESFNDFVKDRGAQRFKYRFEVDVDIVPYGAIADEDGNIAWPPDEAVVMSAIGFEDAYRDSITIVLRKDPYLDVQVASPASIAALKILAWSERGNDNPKDALDLKHIMDEYIDAGHSKRLWGEHEDLIELYGDAFDYKLAGVRILGRDMGALLSEKPKDVITTLLKEATVEEEDASFKLVIAMIGRHVDQEAFRTTIIALRELLSGITDTASASTDA